jgi:alkaline phosphatase
MKLSIAISALLLVATADARRLGSKSTKSESEEKKCPKSYSQTHHGPFPVDNSERLLHREGVIEDIPASLCSNSANGKNVMLVVGDGMGWEMVRAGAIAKAVIEELEGMGCDTKTGCASMAAAKSAFAGRALADYYTEGKGHGLSFQELDGFGLVTTSTVVLQGPNVGALYAPANSLLEGGVSDHYNGMAPLAKDGCTETPIDFSPLNYETEGGNMVLWDDEIGGAYPWDHRYFAEDGDGTDKFDKEFIMRHATDSASTAGALATGHKAAVNMMSVNLYEEDVSTIVEDAMKCGKAAGVISSVPVLHATPGSFVAHSNYRKNGPQMQRSLEKVNPTYIAGGCASSYQPSEAHKDKMREGGSLSSSWTIIEQSAGVLAADFYAPLEGLDPNDDQHVLACFGGKYSPSGEQNAPYRGLDSTYSARYCSSGSVETDADGNITGVTPTTSDELCNHYSAEEVAQLPTMTEHVKAAVDFLGKDEDGFFLMYEQGDIDWAAHANHMDDMLGTMLDVSDGVQYMMDWIAANGGWEKNALYVTADHDHYLTLNDNFPEAVANFLINGESHKITPQNNSQVDPWSVGVAAGRHEDDSKSQTEHIKDFATWTDEDIQAVGHFWGAVGSGGNGWGNHSTRPVPIHHAGDDGCLHALEGAGYKVLGRDVVGSDGKVDQVHVHACMMKALFGM